MAQIETAHAKSQSAVKNPAEREPARRGMNAVGAGFIWILFLAGAAVLVYYTALEPYALLLLLVPAVLSAFAFNRSFYAFAILTTCGVEIAITLLKKTLH